MIRGLDDDEIDFLEHVDRTKLNAERKQLIEDHKEMLEFRQRVATLQEKSHDDKIHAEVSAPKPKSTVTTNRLSQKSILAGVVIKKRKASETEQEIPTKVTKDEEKTSTTVDVPVKSSGSSTSTGLQVIGILPGLGEYRSESSSDSDCEESTAFDLVGRKIMKRAECGE